MSCIITSENFNEKIQSEITRAKNYLQYQADNFEIAVILAHQTVLCNIQKKGYLYLMNNLNNINDCNTGYLNYNTLLWKDLLKKLNIYLSDHLQ